MYRTTVANRQSRTSCATSLVVIAATYKNYWISQPVVAWSVAQVNCRTNRLGWLPQAAWLVELSRSLQRCRILATLPWLEQSTMRLCWKNRNRILPVVALTWLSRSLICWWNPSSRDWHPAQFAAAPFASLTCPLWCSRSSILFPRHCFRSSSLWTNRDSYRP